MIVNTGKRTLQIGWKHKMEGSKKWTQCIVREGSGPNAVELAVAKSHLHKGDIFKKNLGRKVSMTKALMELSSNPAQLDRQERTAIWSKYVEMRNGKIN